MGLGRSDNKKNKVITLHEVYIKQNILSLYLNRVLSFGPNDVWCAYLLQDREKDRRNDEGDETKEA